MPAGASILLAEGWVRGLFCRESRDAGHEIILSECVVNVSVVVVLDAPEQKKFFSYGFSLYFCTLVFGIIIK